MAVMDMQRTAAAGGRPQTQQRMQGTGASRSAGNRRQRTAAGDWAREKRRDRERERQRWDDERTTGLLTREMFWVSASARSHDLEKNPRRVKQRPNPRKGLRAVQRPLRKYARRTNTQTRINARASTPWPPANSGTRRETANATTADEGNRREAAASDLVGERKRENKRSTVRVANTGGVLFRRKECCVSVPARSHDLEMSPRQVTQRPSTQAPKQPA